MNRAILLGVFSPLVLFAAGCNLFDSSEAEKSSPGSSVGGGNAGGTGGAGGTAGTGAVIGCSGVLGAEMVQVSSPSGKAYCIDRTEVTQSQYAQFLAENKTPPGKEHPECAVNGDFVPVQNPPDSIEPKPCQKGESWTPESTPNRPVVCIDWCDAYAYCVWAGKRLCGRIGGGGLTTPGPMLDANESQWYNACTQGGKTDYPYGDTYQPGACEGVESGASWSTKKDVATRIGCKGVEPPFDSIFDLSGSVMEFTDECESNAPGEVVCIARGGAYSTGQDGMGCGVGTNVYGMGIQAEMWFGFRCCKDL